MANDKQDVLIIKIEGTKPYDLENPDTLSEASKAYKDLVKSAEEAGFKVTSSQKVGRV